MPLACPVADHRPVVDAGADRSIPIRTPFVLTGAATDAESAQQAGLTYLWEQNNPGSAGAPLGTHVSGPLFRVFGTYANVTAANTLLYSSPGENLAGTTPSRTFPDLPQILAGNTNAASGTCPAPLAAGTIPITDPALNCFSEFLPTSDWVGTGDRVLHSTFGMGKVVATSGEGDKSMADVDFGSSGLKRLSLKHAPLEKM